MKKIFILFFISFMFGQANIETKEYTFYKSNNNNEIDFNDVIPGFNGIYEVRLINLSNIKTEEVKQTIIKQCELKLTLSTKADYDNYKSKNVLIKSVKGTDVSLCDGELTVENNILIDELNSSLMIMTNNYKEFSGDFTFWISGIFNDVPTLHKNKNHGYLREWYDDESLYIEYKFENGKKNGIQKRWHPNGQQDIIYNYNNGKLEGQQKSWYKNGQIKATWNYQNDKQHGTNQEWYSNGNIKSVKIFDNGILIDVLESYDINGNNIN